ncbi:MAG TPA: hypothetical protein PLW65_15800 [Pseudomonadota bacterium]|nr:hypothetical protein [Pseudomonadota bacterium]
MSRSLVTLGALLYLGAVGHAAGPAPAGARADAVKVAAAPAAAKAPAATAPAGSDASAGGDRPDAEPEISGYDSPALALTAILQRAEADAGGSAPRVVAFGEYHELKGNTGVKSALKRFGEQLLAVLQPLTSDLVLETWVTAGGCGKDESKVVKDVAKTTKRPVTTENELVTLIKQARESHVQPHILELSCGEYQGLLDKEGAVDYEKMLTLLSDLLARKIAQVKLRREAAGVRKIVAVYGGALHNDLYPSAEFRPYTFGPGTAIAFPGQYLEVDLYVPEFIDKDPGLSKEPWFAKYLQARRSPARDGHPRTWVVRRGKGSFILLFAPTKK